VQCKYLRRTHEYLDHKGKTIHDAVGISVHEHGDGGCRADKYERDIKLLKLDLKDNPTDARAMFYLARTLRDVGDVHNALKWYRRRVLQSEFEEERWTAQLHIGRLELSEKNIKTGRQELWKAFSQRPWRAEPLIDLANSYMDSDRHMACRIARIGKSIPYPNGDILFIERNVYRFDFDRVLAICSFYIGEMEQGLKSADSMRLMTNCYRHNEALDHLIFYVKPIKSEWFRDVPNIPVESGWHPCNPSIIPCDGGYAIALRTVNYEINSNGGYIFSGGVVKTRTYLINTCSNVDSILSVVELESLSAISTSLIQNVEDVRLSRIYDGIVVGLGVRADVHVNGVQRMYYLEWDQNSGKCTRQEELSVSRPEYAEKNWLPFRINEALKVLYSNDPVTILDATTDLVLEAKNPSQYDLSGFRGSAAPIQWGEHWLYVVHETTSHRTDKKRTYIHRFCLMTYDYKFLKCSAPFYFEERGIEFCAGMARYKDGVILTYGINDTRARMTYVTENTINEMLGTSS
jgi:tetratricopeptide (TPR) repeat protein